MILVHVQVLRLCCFEIDVTHSCEQFAWSDLESSCGLVHIVWLFMQALLEAERGWLYIGTSWVSSGTKFIEKLRYFWLRMSRGTFEIENNAYEVILWVQKFELKKWTKNSINWYEIILWVQKVELKKL